MILVEGDFVQRRRKRALLGLLEVADSGPAVVCPAVQDMLWLLMQEAGRALVYIPVSPIYEDDDLLKLDARLAGDEVRFVRQRHGHDTVLVAEIQGTKGLGSVLSIWNGEQGIPPAEEFTLFVSGTVTLESVSAADSGVLWAHPDKRLLAWGPQSEYVISDFTEGKRDEFSIWTLEAERAVKAANMIENLWRYYGVSVRRVGI